MSDNPLSVVKDSDSLKGLLKQPEYANRFKEVLGEKSAQFVSSLINVGSTMRDVEPRSIIGSAMVAAVLDLPIDKNLGFAWIVPYRSGDRKYAQFQLGFRGLVQLAQRTSQYAKLNAQPINKEVFNGYDEVGEPVLDWTQYDPTAEVWGYFFGFKLVNGFTKTAVWTKEKVIKHAKKYSQSYRSGAEIWTKEFDAMATKTVIANTLRKWGPLSVQLQTAFMTDSAIVRDIDAIPERTEDVDEIVEHPSFEHPAQQEQPKPETVEQEAKPEEEPKKKSRKKDEPVAQPKPETKPEPQPEQVPQKTDEQIESEMGLAPEQPKEPENVVKLPVAEEKPKAPEPPKEPAKEKAKAAEAPAPALNLPPEPQVSPQMKLKDIIEKAGFTFIEFVQTFTGAIFPKNQVPGSWQQIPVEKAQYFSSRPDGVLTAIKNWKHRQIKK